jgi:murein DD-endopeptidase MepM/ murein hydrolase activator NlpD
MQQLKFLTRLCVVFIFCFSCKSPAGLFKKQSAHEQYSKKVSDAGLKATSMGNLWFVAADKALSQPISVTLPYRQIGYFAADKPRAVGLQFSANRGEKLIFQLDKNPKINFSIFAELWQASPSNTPSFLMAFDTIQIETTYVVEDETNFIIRLQPELLRSGDYELSISVGPSLTFPVAGKVSNIGSIWGDNRDAGARRHEGIDIFAPKRTPVVAAYDGVVNRVNETNIGGKVVWLRPKSKNLNLYYAHLDEQLVSDGQRVSAGDTLGLIGNTGNARTTPPHLHFGIYGFGGAIDPLPFVNTVVKKPEQIKISIGQLNRFVRTNRKIVTGMNTIEKNTPLFVSDANQEFYIAVLPDGNDFRINQNFIQSVDNQLNTVSLNDSINLLDHPSPNAGRKSALTKKSSVKVLGYYQEFAFVETTQGDQGWIPKASL